MKSFTAWVIFVMHLITKAYIPKSHASSNRRHYEKIVALYPAFRWPYCFSLLPVKKSVPDQVKYIPKDAMFILDLDWKSLSDKTAKGNIN